jgi:hypothetical protein
MHVSDAGACYFSVSALMQKGAQILFKNNKLLISLWGQQIAEGYQVLHPLAYLWCHMLTCTYILLSYIPPDHFYRTCLPIWDSTDFAVISILSSYFLFRVTVLTFLISLSFSCLRCPSYSESPPLYPVRMSQFLLFAYDSFCYNDCTILCICQLITEQLMHRLQLVWLGL